MRLVLVGLASCMVIISIGCGVELTKEEGTRRTAGGVGGIITDNPLDGTSSPSGSGEGEQPVEDSPAEPEPEQTAESSEAPSEQPASEPSEDENVERVAAKRGVGAKGRIEGSGMVVTPLKAYFLTQQRVVYEIQIPHAMNLYRATNGNFPKTQEEFMREIIETNMIKLPELPPGHRYVYDPKKAELMVERPAN